MGYTKNRFCSTCPKEEISFDGECSRSLPDGQVARCGPPWTITKHKYFEGYCEIFSNAMPRTFPDMAFIDLFSGPGLYYHRPSGDVFHGSPLIASRYNFKKLIFCDLKQNNINALKHRLTNARKTIEFYLGNSNRLVESINSLLSDNSLNFCLADPDNMHQLHFSTLRTLTENKRVDLLINFPYGNSFKRGALNAFRSVRRNTTFDLYFGTIEWREIFANHNFTFSDELGLEIMKLYLDQFYKIGYVVPKKPHDNNYVIIKNTQNREIYYLIYLSKNSLGYKFWAEAVRYTKGGNFSFDFL